MSILIKITNEQRRYSEFQVKKDSFCNKDYDNLFKGYLGEVIFADYFQISRPVGFVGSKPPYDFFIDGFKVDVKTTNFKTALLSDLKIGNFKFVCDYYVFIVLKGECAELVGFIEPKEFFGLKGCSWRDLYSIEGLFGKGNGFSVNFPSWKKNLVEFIRLDRLKS